MANDGRQMLCLILNLLQHRASAAKGLTEMGDGRTLHELVHEVLAELEGN